MMATSLPALYRNVDYFVITAQPTTTAESSFIMLVAKDMSQSASVTVRAAVSLRGTSYSTGQTIGVTFTNLPLTALITSSGELTGSKVVVTGKSINVYAGNFATKVGTGTLTDDMMEEFPPKLTWGKRFVALPYTGSAKSQLYLYSETSFTTSNIRITPSVTATSISNTIKYSLAADTAYFIESDNQAMAVHFQESGTVGSQRPANIYIPPISQWTSGHRFYVPTDRIAILGLVIESGFLDGLKFGTSQAKSIFTFKALTGTTMVYATGQVTAGNVYTLSHDSKAAYGAQIYQYNPNGACAEATHLGMRLLDYDQVCEVDNNMTYCIMKITQYEYCSILLISIPVSITNFHLIVTGTTVQWYCCLARCRLSRG